MAATINILHFNDVYNIEPRDIEPVGGAARITHYIKSVSDMNPLVLFSGDALNPSMMSTVTKGQQMIPVLNAMDVKCAVYGNHDFDFGVEELAETAKKTNFPWLMTNVMDIENGEPLADGKITHMIEWQGKKIGLLGLVEEEWIDTLACIDKEDVQFISFIDEGKRLSKQLREQGADIIIALTHMRWPNDTKLAEQVEGVDLILGGHDHDYVVKQVNGKYIIKSGTDFQNMSHVTIRFDDTGGFSVNIEKIDIDSSIEEDEEIKQIVDKYTDVMKEKMEEVLGSFEVELEGRFSKVRTQETNLGNFICDIMCACTGADLAILNSGTLRSDRIHPRGEFKVKDLSAILPMIDPCVVISIKGKEIIEALENSVYHYPTLEGRFAQVAGVSFGFDPSKTPGCRIDAKRVYIGPELIDMDQSYKLVTKSYLILGKDGYDVFKNCEVLVDDENGPRLTTVVKNHFSRIKEVVQSQSSQNVQLKRSRRSMSQLARRHSITSLTGSGLDTPCKNRLLKQSSVHCSDQLAVDGTDGCEVRLSPEVEGRIYVVSMENTCQDKTKAQIMAVDAAVKTMTILEATDSQELDDTHIRTNGPL